MARVKKYTQNINKDADLIDIPKVKVPHSQWESKFSNYLTCNIGDIVPIYCEEVVPNSKRRITMGMISHMTTPIAPIFNAMYNELRCFWVPHRLSSDLLGGYSTRKEPFQKVKGIDPASSSAEIIVDLSDQKLPKISTSARNSFQAATFNAFGGLADALDMEVDKTLSADNQKLYIEDMNFLSMAAYELIYHHCYRNPNRESATASNLYKFLFNAYNRASSIAYDDSFHKANREKDYFTGSQPFTLKANEPVSVSVLGEAPVKVKDLTGELADDFGGSDLAVIGSISQQTGGQGSPASVNLKLDPNELVPIELYASLKDAKGLNIEQLRLMVKTQELLEKDMWSKDFAGSLNAHFGTAPMSLVLQEPLELKKTIIASEMQPIFQTSVTSGEATILGTIGANSTTQAKDIEICPLTEFKEEGYLIVCACHKAQNTYDSLFYKPKHLFKKARFDWFTPELTDLGYQPVQGKEFKFNPVTANGLNEAVSFNEAWAEYRYRFNRVHGMFESSRSGALDFWTLDISGYTDIQSLYKQGVTELNRSISVVSSTLPQFLDAYGFIEYHDEPMSLHSIPGMDGVI